MCLTSLYQNLSKMAGTKYNKKPSMELEIGESARSRSDVLEGIRQMGSYGQEQATAEMAAVVSATPRPGVPSSLRVTRANQVKEHRFHRAATWQEVGPLPLYSQPQLNL